MTGRPEHDLSSTVVRSATEPQQNALVRLRKRREFITVRKGQRAFCKGLIVQALPQRPAKGKEIRVGFTCSKKVGNAVTRNRAKRRLRELARTILPTSGFIGWDYVLIGRSQTTVGSSFADLKSDLRQALSTIHASTKR